MVLSNGKAVNFWNEFHLLLRLFVQCYRCTQSIQVIISERFLTETWCSRSTRYKRIKLKLISVRSTLWLLNCINISCNEFQFSINILFPTSVVDGHPSSNVSKSFSLIQTDRVVGFPLKTSRPVSNFTRSSDFTFTVNFPVECRCCEEAIRQRRKFDSRDFIVYVNSKLSFKDITRIMT